MFNPKVILCSLLLSLPLTVFGQNATLNSTAGATAGAAAETAAPKLEHFDANLTDQSLNPCDDFYKYSCNKWITANPIPPDQVYWTTGSSLELWNENVLRETLDESGIEAAGLKPLQPELDRIAALKSKKEITLEIAHLHHLFPGAWEGNDNQT